GTLENEAQEEKLEALIHQLTQYPEALGDYRKWLASCGIETKGMRTMGSAEATMSQLAKRMKNGRSWVEDGKRAMMTGLIAHLDHMSLQTVFGRMDRWNNSQQEEENPPKHYVEKVTHTVGEWTRGNLQYLQGKSGIPMHRALKALQGF
ncbi:ISLre2 family transposase, partial [Sporolactobacillus sp. THM7-7]